MPMVTSQILKSVDFTKAQNLNISKAKYFWFKKGNFLAKNTFCSGCNF